MALKILKLDIETAPNLAHVWGLFRQNVAVGQIAHSCEILCWAAQWEGDKKIHFAASWEEGGFSGMMEQMHELLEEADAVMHYNGTSFDIPHLNKAFLTEGLLPPSPYKQIDLLQIVRKKFRFTSNKLEYVSKELGIGRKVPHYGFQLWLDVMSGQKKAQALMKKYNKMDVELLGDLYAKVLPWMTNHPHHALYSDSDERMCPNCGGNHFHAHGVAHTQVMSYKRLQCQDCGTWVRGRKGVIEKSKRQDMVIQEKY